VTAEIKPAQCCIKLVFHLTYTMMHGNTKLKFSDARVKGASHTITELGKFADSVVDRPECNGSTFN
jgi:hypothetical protein